MKIRTKSLVLYSALMVALTAALVHQFLLVGLLEKNQELSSRNVQAIQVAAAIDRTAIRLGGQINALAGSSGPSRKGLRLADPVTLPTSLLVEEAEKLSMLFRGARLVELSAQERSRLDDLLLSGEGISLGISRLSGFSPPIGSAGFVSLLQRLEADLERLQRSAVEFRLAVEGKVRELAEESAQAAHSTRSRLLWMALLVGPASAFAGATMLRSNLRLLGNLTKATQSVESGDYDIRLHVDGGDELAQFARRFEKMAGKLSEYESMKRELQASITHDLKAPLTSMQEASQLMLNEKLSGPLNSDQKELLKLSLKSGERLFALILNLLDLESMEEEAFLVDRSAHDLRPIAQGLCEEVRLRVLEKGLSLAARVPDQPIEALCDERRIRQLMGNLIENALAFSPSGSTVGFELSRVGIPPAPALTRFPQLARTLGPLAMISVTDSGPGIPDDQKEAIFGKFYQIDDAGCRNRRSSGLGLAICSKIVQAHNGAIWVEDCSAGGSDFRVLLPSPQSRRSQTSRLDRSLDSAPSAARVRRPAYSRS